MYHALAAVNAEHLFSGQPGLPVSAPFDSQAMVAQSVPCQVFSFVWHQTLWIGSLPQCILYLGPHSIEVCFVFLLFQSNMSGSFLFLCSQFGWAKLFVQGWHRPDGGC